MCDATAERSTALDIPLRTRALLLVVRMPEALSREEAEAAVSDYLRMLEMELRGESYGKAERNRQLQALLRGRNRGAIERKHQNISAILIELGFPSLRFLVRPLHRLQLTDETAKDYVMLTLG
jgi:hypothetical protein